MLHFNASFDTNSLFPNTHLTETLINCVKNVYRNQQNVCDLTTTLFYALLKTTMCKSFFIFVRRFYEQYDSVTLSFPL